MTTPFVELRRFKKDILRVGSVVHPSTGEVLSFTSDYLKMLAESTNLYIAKGGGSYIPLQHVENPLSNAGWVEQFIYDEGTQTLYAIMNITEPEVEAKIERGTIKDVSVRIVEGFEDAKGNKYPAIIEHVALTLKPVLAGQGPFVHLSRFEPASKRLSMKDLERWTTSYINDLPDGSFAVIEPAYMRGETENKNARHLPHHGPGGGGTKNVNLDLPHLRNAFARANQIKPVTDSISTEELRKKAIEHLEKHRSALKSASLEAGFFWETFWDKNLAHINPEEEQSKVPASFVKKLYLDNNEFSLDRICEEFITLENQYPEVFYGERRVGFVTEILPKNNNILARFEIEDAKVAQAIRQGSVQSMHFNVHKRQIKSVQLTIDTSLTEQAPVLTWEFSSEAVMTDKPEEVTSQEFSLKSKTAALELEIKALQEKILQLQEDKKAQELQIKALQEAREAERLARVKSQVDIWVKEHAHKILPTENKELVRSLLFELMSKEEACIELEMANGQKQKVSLAHIVKKLYEDMPDEFPKLDRKKDDLISVSYGDESDLSGKDWARRNVPLLLGIKPKSQ